MSQEESKFIRQLKITLIAILTPFLLGTAGNAVNDHFKLQNLRQHIEAIEDDYVSQDILLLYLNELRVQSDLLHQAITENDSDIVEVRRELRDHNSRLDEFIQQVYTSGSRGAKALLEANKTE